MLQRIVLPIILLFYFPRKLSAAYTLGPCLHEPSSNCYFDMEMLSISYTEYTTLAHLFDDCNGVNWINTQRNWCHGTNLAEEGLRVSDDEEAPLNEYCEESVITDPCTGKLVQFPASWPVHGDKSPNYPSNRLSDADDYDDFIWDNVDCSTISINTYVTGLSLQGPMNISCDLDSVMEGNTNLTHLVDLDLKDNAFIIGNVPGFIGELSDLQTLHLEDCGLDGTIPATISDAPALIDFYISGNSIEGTLPRELGSLTTLVNFDISNNKLSGSLPAGIANFSSLQTLIAKSNSLEGKLPSLRYLTQLTALQLNKNRLSGELTDGDDFLLGSRATIEDVNMQSNEFTGHLPANFTDYLSLEKLRFQDNHFTGVVPLLPSGLKKLTLGGSGNHWHCPFPENPDNDEIIRNALKELDCYCPPGSYCPLLAPAGSRTKRCNSTCATCTAGRFTNVSYSNSTEDGTQRGRIESGQGCYACVPGTAAAAEGATGCTACPAGTFANSSASVRCDACPKGRASVLSSHAVACDACSPGKYANSLNSTFISFRTPTVSGAYDPQMEYTTYMPVGAPNCTSCAAGYAQPRSGAASCIACALGKYQEMVGSVTCSNCSAGSFSGSVGQAACQFCPRGKAQSLTGQVACSICVTGKAATTAGQNFCDDCEPGTHSPSNGAENCTRCDFLRGMAQNESGKSNCSYCPGGTFAGDGSNCTLCPLGRGGIGSTRWRRYEYPSRPGTLSVFQCKGCAAGSFADARGFGGLFNSICDSASNCDPETACTYCPVGKVAIDSETGEAREQWEPGASSCTICPVGKKWLHESKPCKECSPGRFQENQGKEICDICPNGFYQTENGSSSCSICAVGKRWLHEAIECEECPAGRYQAAQGQDTCELCPDGKYQTEDGTASCSLPPPGYYWTSVTSIAPCPSGKFSVALTAARSAADCVKCPAGRYNEAMGQANCSNCSSGTFAPIEGSISRANCTACTAGKFSHEGSPECSACLPGTAVGAPLGSIGAAGGCQPCARGFYSSATLDPTFWTPEEAMSNTAFFGSTSCTAAPPGSYISQFGSPVAMLCPQGSFSSSAGAWNCTRCGTNDFQDNLGSTECARCPNGTLQDNNGTSCRYCSLGRYQAYVKSSSAFPEQNSPPRTCRACPPDTFSDQRGVMRCTKCSQGYHTNNAYGSTSCVESRTSKSETSFKWASGSLLFFFGSLLLCTITCVCCARHFHVLARRKAEIRADAREALDDTDEESNGLLGGGRVGMYKVTHHDGVTVFSEPEASIINGSGKGQRLSGVSSGSFKSAGVVKLRNRADPLAVKGRGEIVKVVASKDDWLMLSDGEGWILGYDRRHGALISKIIDSPENISNGADAHLAKIRSSIYGNVGDLLSLQDSNRKRRSSRASQLIAHPGDSLGMLYEATSGSASRASRAVDRWGARGASVADYRPEPALYYVDLQEKKYEAPPSYDALNEYWEGINAPADERTDKDAVSSFEAVLSGGFGSFNSGVESLFGSIRSQHSRGGQQQVATPPPRPTKDNPLLKIEELQRAGNNSTGSEEESDESERLHRDSVSIRNSIRLTTGVRSSITEMRTPSIVVIENNKKDEVPLPEPLGVIPQIVSAAHFADANKSHYEVIYPRVRVRDGPSLRTKVCGYRKAGDIVEVVDESRHWVKIKDARKSKTLLKSNEYDSAHEEENKTGWILRYQKAYGPLLRMLEVEKWVKYEDSAFPGRYYYFNKATRECTWKDPRVYGHRRENIPPPPMHNEQIKDSIIAPLQSPPLPPPPPTTTTAQSISSLENGTHLQLPPPPVVASKSKAKLHQSSKSSRQSVSRSSSGRRSPSPLSSPALRQNKSSSRSKALSRKPASSSTKTKT